MISALSLRNFRNHADFSVDFSPLGALIVGANGSGKTSLLEAIFLLATLKSFRAKTNDTFIKTGEDFCEISAQTETQNLIFRTAMRPRKGTALFFDATKKTTTDFLTEKSFCAVLFSPEDLILPFSPPDRRRRFLNRLLFPLDASLFSVAREFERVLASRNALLRRISDGLAKRNEILFYDEKLCSNSIRITEARADFFSEIAEEISQYYFQISGKDESLEIRFSPDSLDDLPEKLNKNFVLDCARGSTSNGAHRDDFEFFLRGKNIGEVGSRGEIRSAILALKMAEKSFLKRKTGQNPILLLDDVFSELDADRRRHLTSFFENSQIFLTATDAPRRAFLGRDFPLLFLK